MRQHKIKMLMIGIVLVLIALISFLFIRRAQLRREQLALEQMRSRTQSILASYPEIPEPYGSTMFYFCDGTYEYLLLANGERVVTARRMKENPVETTYYADGRAWVLTEEQELVESEPCEDPVTEYVRTLVAELRSEEVTYSYDIARGRDLYCWVFAGEPYLLGHRARYPESTEVVSYRDTNGDAHMIWDIIYSARDVILFLEMASRFEKILRDDAKLPNTWGQLPEGIYEMIR